LISSLVEGEVEVVLKKRSVALLSCVGFVAMTLAAPEVRCEEVTELIPPQRTITYDPDLPKLTDVKDPMERSNRAVYAFNAQFDRFIFLPTVRGYQKVTPDPLEKGITNIFANLGEVTTFVNATLQAKPRSAGVTLGRFVVNSTIGILGLFDPATKIGMVRRNEDFGQTLGRWGVGNGSYLVLPLLGPSNLRDGTGTLVDAGIRYGIHAVTIFDDESAALVFGVGLLNAVDTRANISFRYYETGSPFEYELVRYLYTRMREIKIAK
jgi:phospholipid-binding lipoprotein MlaA